MEAREGGWHVRYRGRWILVPAMPATRWLYGSQTAEREIMRHARQQLLKEKEDHANA
jgi:hypothetical protein